MREEITEPRHWRSSQPRHTFSRTFRPRAPQHTLPADIVDAALAEPTDEINSANEVCSEAEDINPDDIIRSLKQQLDLLEQQRVKIQQLLAQSHTGE